MAFFRDYSSIYWTDNCLSDENETTVQCFHDFLIVSLTLVLSRGELFNDDKKLMVWSRGLHQETFYPGQYALCSGESSLMGFHFCSVHSVPNTPVVFTYYCLCQAEFPMFIIHAPRSNWRLSCIEQEWSNATAALNPTVISERARFRWLGLWSSS